MAQDPPTDLKAMRVYHFINRKFGLQSIHRGRLKVAMIDDLNDPFEFLGVASERRNLRRRYAVLKSGLSRYMGLLCFSANWRNPVQWSHYADGHRGVCLGFDVAADLHRVRYVNERLKPNSSAMKSGGARAERHMHEILTSKFSHWQYEEEYRLFVRLEDQDSATGLYFFKFGDQLRLREIIVGHLSTVSRGELASVIGVPRADVVMFKARLAFQTFEVVRQKSARRWK